MFSKEKNLVQMWISNFYSGQNNFETWVQMVVDQQKNTRQNNRKQHRFFSSCSCEYWVVHNRSFVKRCGEKRGSLLNGFSWPVFWPMKNNLTFIWVSCICPPTTFWEGVKPTTLLTKSVNFLKSENRQQLFSENRQQLLHLPKTVNFLK